MAGGDSTYLFQDIYSPNVDACQNQLDRYEHAVAISYKKRDFFLVKLRSLSQTSSTAYRLELRSFDFINISILQL